MTEATFPLDHGVVPILLPSRIERAGPPEVDRPPACPACGSATVRKTARSGRRAGGAIWSCVNFPGCRGQMDVEETVLRRPGGSTAPDANAADRWTPRGAIIGPSSPAGAAAGMPAMAVGPQRTIGSGAAARVTGGTAAATGAALTAARQGVEAIGRASSVAVEVGRPVVQRTAARMVDWGLDVLHPGAAAEMVDGRDVAGASAQAEFERRRSRHRLRMRRALPLVAAVTVIAMVTVFLVLLATGVGTAGLGALAAGGVGVWVIGRLPADALASGREAAGERRTAEYLDELTSSGYVLLHDRVIPGLRMNIDHVAIGPSGIFVIETKSLRGKLTIVADKLFVGERTRTGVVDDTYREALAVQVCLADRLNVMRSTVRPILCVERTAQLLLDNEVQGVRVVSGPQLARFLRRLPALLDADTVQALAAVADSRLLPAVP